LGCADGDVAYADHPRHEVEDRNTYVQKARRNGVYMTNIKFTSTTSDEDMTRTYEQEMKPEVEREPYWGWRRIDEKREQATQEVLQPPSKPRRIIRRRKS
jgi:hypothetical protein